MKTLWVYLAVILATWTSGARAQPRPLIARVTAHHTAIEAASQDQRPTRYVTCPRVASPPRIDGNLDEAAWSEATAASNFVVLKTGQPADNRTLVRMVRDDDALYVAYVCRDKSMGQLRAHVHDADGHRLWRDDSVELFVDPGRSRKRYFQWIINANAAVWDAAIDYQQPVGAQRATYETDLPWQSGATAAATRNDEQWTVEMRVPFEAFGSAGREDGAVWGINFNRHRAADKEVSNWAHLPPGGNHQPDHFGNLLFGNPSVLIVKADPGRPLLGDNRLDMTVQSLADRPQRLTARVAAGQTPGWATTFTLRPGAAVDLPLQYRVVGRDKQQLRAVVEDEQGDEVGRREVTFHPPTPLRCRLSSATLFEGTHHGRAQLHVLVGAESLDETSLRLQLQQGSDRITRSSRIHTLQAPRLTAYLNLEDVPAGTYDLVSELRGENGQLLGTTRNRVQIIDGMYDF